MSDFSVPYLLDLLSDEDAALLSSLARRKNYFDGEIIHEEGDGDCGIGVVVSGQVKLIRRRSNGNLLIETTVNPGQSYGEVTSILVGRSTHGAVAAGETVIDHFSPPVYESLLDQPGILRALYRIATFRLARAVDMLDDMRALPIEGRLAKQLAAMATGDDPAEVDCLQEDLANILGVSMMTIAKALGVLKKEGLIETGYRRILVPDARRLHEWGASFHR